MTSSKELVRGFPNRVSNPGKGVEIYEIMRRQIIDHGKNPLIRRIGCSLAYTLFSNTPYEGVATIKMAVDEIFECQLRIKLEKS
jgi:hypothetical protein